MVDFKAPMINVMEDIPAKSTVAVSLVIKSYRIMVKMYVRHALYSRKAADETHDAYEEQYG